MLRSIGFVGVGNMGGAVARAAARSGLAGELLLSNRTHAKAETLARELTGARASANDEIARVCSLIFLAVKPQMMAEVLRPLAPVLAARTDRFVLVTMAAGLSCERVRALAGGAYPVIRMMPNTPVAVGAGVVQYCASDATRAELDGFAALLAPAGTVDEIPESLMDAACSLSGCGPAFVYLFLEGLTDGAVSCGLPRDKALRYAAQTLSGAAALLLDSGRPPEELRQAVCSPGGSTIEGVRLLLERAFPAAAADAVRASYQKNLALGKK